MSADQRMKSYWQSVWIGSDHAKDACMSYFAPLCDGMTPYKADILCDVETDREKKIRAFMTDTKGKKWMFVRTRGRRFSITMKPVAESASANDVPGLTK